MFDPYRKWLGIQPKDQPPNYYRLLSVDLFESDLDVLEGAAERAMSFVRQYQSGKHAEDAARILNEIATARLCLLKPDKKAAYDAKLRKLAADSSQKAAQNDAPESSLTDADLPPLIKRTRKSKQPVKQSSNFPYALIVGVAILCIVIAVFAINGRGNRENHLPANPTAPPPVSPLPTDEVTKQDSAKTSADKTATTVPDRPIERAAQPDDRVGMVRNWKGKLGHGQAAVFSRDGSRIVHVNGSDVLIADTATGRNEIALKGNTKGIWTARFSSDDLHVVSVGQDETIRIWEIATQKLESEIKASTAEYGTVVMESDKRTLIAFSSDQDRALTVLNRSTMSELQTLKLSDPEVYFRAVSRNLKRALSNGINNQTSLWDLETGAASVIDNGHHNYCGDLSHDGGQAILAGENRWDIWDLDSQTKIKEGSVPGGHIYAVATNPEMTRLMTGHADGVVWLWDLSSSKKIMAFSGHEVALRAVMMSPDRKFAVSQDQDQNILLWRLPD